MKMFGIECTEEEKKIAERLAFEVLKLIFKYDNDRTGRWLYLFMQYLTKLTRLYAYYGLSGKKYRFVVITEDEYKSLKDNAKDNEH